MWHIMYVCQSGRLLCEVIPIMTWLRVQLKLHLRQNVLEGAETLGNNHFSTERVLMLYLGLKKLILKPLGGFHSVKYQSDLQGFLKVLKPCNVEGQKQDTCYNMIWLSGYNFTVSDFDHFLMPTNHCCLHGGRRGDCLFFWYLCRVV